MTLHRPSLLTFVVCILSGQSSCYFIVLLFLICVILWPPCIADADIIFLPVVSFFFFSLPNLGHGRLDVYRTSTHDVALVQI